MTAISGAQYGQDQLIANAAAAATTLSLGVGSTSNFTAADFLVVQLTSGDIYSTTISTVNAGAGTITIPGPGLPSAAASNNYVWNYTTKGQRPLEIQTAILRDAQYTDTPLDYMTLQTYEALPTKTQSGNLSDPTAIYYEQQLTNGQLYIDCGGAQDVTKHIHIVGLRPVQDFNAALDNPDYPVEWFDALCWGLAIRIAPMFNAIWTPEMQLNYTSAIAIAGESNPETTEAYFLCNQ